MAKASGQSIAQMKRANELTVRSAAELDQGMARIWQVMTDCIDRGMKGEGILPGGLKVRRRAKGIHDALLAERGLVVYLHAPIPLLVARTRHDHNRPLLQTEDRAAR